MFSRMARKLRRQEEGATMIEYGLLAALVSIAALAALQLLGPALLNIFNQVVNAITGAECADISALHRAIVPGRSCRKHPMIQNQRLRVGIVDL